MGFKTCRSANKTSTLMALDHTIQQRRQEIGKEAPGGYLAGELQHLCHTFAITRGFLSLQCVLGHTRLGHAQ